ncbi:DUF6541 family protein [Arthrobacter sp. Ld5]|uniref:DUF6541 family protein n=1 Tax=Arthrobacter sp. Ld5 TaxID=649152 RepID=UPI003EBCB2A2
MSWWDALPALVSAAALLTLPGLALSAALNVRGHLAFGLAPAFSVALVGVSAVALSSVGIPWSAGSFAATALLLCLIAGLVARLTFRESRRSISFTVDRQTLLGAAAGVALGGVASAYNLARIFDHPDNIAQRYDNVFHLNAVRWVIEQGDASTLTLGRMITPTADIALYPAAWHGLAALVAELTSQPVSVATTTLNLVIASLVWPVSIVLLARVLFGPNIAILAITGIFSAGFAAFPMGLIDFGPLYPNLLSYAVLPAALALVILLLRVGPQDATDQGIVALSLVVASAALLLAQPNGFTALLALSLPVAAYSWWRWAQERTARRGARGALLPLVIAVVAAGSFAVVWQAMLIGYNTWLPFTRYASAIGQALTSAPHGRSIPVVIAICTAVGVAVLFTRSGLRWLLGVYAVVVALYAISAAEPRGSFRILTTGSWYQDPQRLASLLPIPTVVIAAFGASAILTWCWARISTTPLAPAPVGRYLAGGIVAVLALVGGLQSQRGAVDEMVVESRRNHTFEGNPTILSLDELALLERVDDVVPEDAVIAVNPWNGGSLAYAISGRSVTQYHMSSGALPPDLDVLARELDDATASSEACEIAREDDVEYVLDFGDFYLLDRDQARLYPAFDEVADASNLELVDSEGEARLYRVTDCFRTN